MRKGGLSIPQLFNIRFELTHGTQITICVITHNCILNMFVNMYCSTKKLTAGLIYNDFGCDILTLQGLFMMIVLLSNSKESKVDFLRRLITFSKCRSKRNT